MHRQTTQLSKRVPGRAQPFARKLERRGVAATYALHDRILSNRNARRRYSATPPALDEKQQALVAKLDADGFALVPLEDLLGDHDAAAGVLRQGDAFLQGTQH